MADDDKAFQSILDEVEEAVDKERYLVAGRKLDQLAQDYPSRPFTPRQNEIRRLANLAKQAKDELFRPFSDDGWLKQSDIHGDRDTLIYYKVNPEDSSLRIRIETAVEESLLQPLISVFNESDLYETWMPQWTLPRLGLQSCTKLQETGRGNQIIHFIVDVPSPFSTRECIQHVFATDAIESDDSAIVIHVQSLDEGVHHGGLVVGPVDCDKVRVDLEMAIVIRPVPENHAVFPGSNHITQNQHDEERLVLVQLVQSVNGHVAGVPQSLINFVTRTVIGRIWGNLLQVAEDIRNGKRPAHKQAIEAKSELYGWIQQRLQVMFAKLDPKPKMKQDQNSMHDEKEE